MESGCDFQPIPRVFANLKRESAMATVKCGQNGQVFLIPNNPFGWLDSPPSVNRLLGVRWVSHLVSGKPMTEFTKEVKTFLLRVLSD